MGLRTIGIGYELANPGVLKAMLLPSHEQVHATSLAAPRLRHWEVHTTLLQGATDATVERVGNTLGKDEWELVSCLAGPGLASADLLCPFKRPVPMIGQPPAAAVVTASIVT